MPLQADGTYCGGWGSEWGSIPWGGVTCVPQPPSGPTGGWVVGEGRYERVRRQQELREELREERNVIFAVTGLHAKLRCGRVQIGTGVGSRVRLRRFFHLHAALGPVEISASSEAQALPASGAASSAGRIQIAAQTVAHVFIAPGVKAESGKPQVIVNSEVKIRIPRKQFSTEELLTMLAEVL